ncbi:MAG: hypothetical protein E4H10_00165 [Bacteroidia bacterium]|nr:MAG: hypothetical protein E4H10_00165 [Bacteroidia bacterium]
MKTFIFIAFVLLVANTDKCISPLTAQERFHHIIDFVELPAELNIPGDSACFIEFREQWTFLAKGGLIKEVTGQEFSCSSEFPLPDGVARINDISYEFMLLDPHLAESGNKAFSGPDSMDNYTRKLQADLIELIQTHAPISPRYDPRKQLLSVYFHEEWIINPDSMEILKKVSAITPVIWQRRQTVEGKSIDEGDSGLPVYYKTPLQKIFLRHP